MAVAPENGDGQPSVAVAVAQFLEETELTKKPKILAADTTALHYWFCTRNYGTRDFAGFWHFAIYDAADGEKMPSTLDWFLSESNAMRTSARCAQGPEHSTKTEVRAEPSSSDVPSEIECDKVDFEVWGAGPAIDDKQICQIVGDTHLWTYPAAQRQLVERDFSPTLGPRPKYLH